MRNVFHNGGCRICKNKRLTKILKFGQQPLANAFLNKDQINRKESFYPLDVYFCKRCCLVQLRDIVSPKILFKDYVYVSSTSPLFIKHFSDFAQRIITRFQLNSKSLVVDIGSNDGILLKPYVKRGIKVLGIEPAENIAQLARKEGVDTYSEFFSLNLVKKIKNQYGSASVVTATNVFAHINDIDEVTKGVYKLLNDQGVFIIEVPYLVDFLEKNLFDTVYHEHLSYFSLSPLILFFNKCQMRVLDVERVTTHGGSLRIFVTKKEAKHKLSLRVKSLLELEKIHKVNQLSTYRRFAKRIKVNKNALLKLLSKLKRSGNRIVGYGAPAKGNTLLNYFGIGTKYLDYIVEDSPYKQGLFTPGTHIPVVAPIKLEGTLPNYIFILAWNFADTIMHKYAHLKTRGVKFIIPVPTPQII